VRIFLAGATSLIGQRLIVLMTSLGHEVGGMTRSPSSAELLKSLGAVPVVCDVYDVERLHEAVGRFNPDLVMHQLTDLPDAIDEIPQHMARHERIRTEGTANLLSAASQAGVRGFMLQSIAWPGGPALQPWSSSPVVQPHERKVLDVGGTVLRYGQFYGPGTYHEGEPPGEPRIHIDEAARRTTLYLTGGHGVIEVVD